MDIEKIIASRSWIAVKRSTGVRCNVHFQVGKPYWLNPREAECAVELVGLFENIAPAIGVDTLQAMQLALSVENLVQMKSDEYDFYYPEDGSHYFDETAPNIKV